MIKTLFTSQTSACFEWQNDLPYYKDKKYTIYLNGKEVLSSDTNIFSLFDLEPSTEYVITSDALDFFPSHHGGFHSLFFFGSEELEKQMLLQVNSSVFT